MLQNLSITPASPPNLSMKSPWRFTLCMMGFLDLEKHFAFYGAYHSNPINIVIHICLDKKSGFVVALMCFACWVGSSVFADRLGPSLAVKLAPPFEFALFGSKTCNCEESGFEETHIVESVSWDDLERNAASKAGGCSKRHHSWRSHQHDSSRKDDESPGNLYELWRQEQNIIAARLDKELKSRWELDELIEEQLSRYQSHYFKTMVSTSLKDVSNLLMPTWIPPHELAAVSWLGDWQKDVSNLLMPTWIPPHELAAVSWLGYRLMS
uniref:DOG1 domain-containing protein n=1 Tax=Brassica oleracea var. oleracea TaxID=109376 RepID=A0A0D3BXG5_BRAOL